MQGSINRATLILLGAATLLVSVAVAALAQDQPFPAPAGILLWAVAFGQLSLLALYLALGTAPWPLRAASVAVGIVAWVAASRVTIGASASAVATDLTLHAGGIALVAALARVGGIRWAVAMPRVDWKGTARGPQRQFALADLLGWTAIATLLAALARYAVAPGSSMGGRGGLLVGSGVVVGLTAAWTAAAARHWPLRWAVLTALSTALGLIAAPPAGGDPGPWVTFYALQALLVAAWITAARTAGVRIGRVATPATRPP